MKYTELKAAFMTARSDKSAATVKAYRVSFDRFGAFCGEQTPTEQIDSATILAYRAALERGGVSQNSVSDYLKKLSSLFTFAVEHSFVQDNPVRKSDIPRQKFAHDLLSKEQIEQTLTRAPSKVPNKHVKKAARNRAIVFVLLCCGLRNSELRALTPADLDFESGTISVRHGKGDKYRAAPFPAKAQEAVKAYLASGARPQNTTQDAPLFGTTSDKTGRKNSAEWHAMSAVGLEKIVEQYFEQTTGKKGLKVHALRHAAASLWDDLGVPMRDVQQALGHASISTTEQIYVKVLNKCKAARSINNAFDA